MSNALLRHGSRPTKGNRRMRKGVDEYVAENRVDFTSRSVIKNGQPVQLLVCRFCCLAVGARSDRIKEHLKSKRHQKLKEAHFKSQDTDQDLENIGDANAPENLPEPPISRIRFPGITFPVQLEGGQSEFSPSSSFQPPGQLQETPESDSTEVGCWSDATTTSCPSPGSSDIPTQPQWMHIKWGNYGSNFGTMFSKMRSQKQFVDISLWCEGNIIRCHKLVLSACSTHFEKLLTQYSYPEGLIFLRDMEYCDVQALVDFMYQGEVKVMEERLPNLLQAAKSLQIKGLSSLTPSMVLQSTATGAD